jgi:concanavalin A-like lectin/glucanase superfamily protein
MRKRRMWIVTLAASIAAVPVGGTPARADSNLVAYWSMNEPVGSRYMYDSSGNGLHGSIGSEVVTARPLGDALGYGFGRLEPDTPPARPQHLVAVPDYPALDPGDRDYSVSLRIRTPYQFGNVIQKGQATVAGGSFKIQIPGGKVQCWFRGSAGQVLVTGPRPVNDRAWHTITCTRFQAGVALDIDGVRVAAKLGATGTISNAWPLSIGGKTNCDQVQVGCDYFAGDLDWVRIDAAGHDW